MTTRRAAVKRAPERAGWVIMMLAGFSCGGCKPVPPAGATFAGPAPPGSSSQANLEAIVDPIREENEQLRQALELALTAQQNLTGQVRRDHEILASMGEDIGLLRERLRDLELAHDRQPVAAPAPRMVQQRPPP
ncbi:MAG TPA: hypothetical protein VGD78_18015 [Chthoniobacterales bacterium]